VDWCTSEVKNCELVGNQARADVCSTATDEVRSTRESLPDPRYRSRVSRGSIAYAADAGAGPRRCGDVGVGVALLGLFTGCADGSIEARANSHIAAIGVLFRVELREYRCGRRPVLFREVYRRQAQRLLRSCCRNDRFQRLHEVSTKLTVSRPCRLL